MPKNKRLLVPVGHSNADVPDSTQSRLVASPRCIGSVVEAWAGKPAIEGCQDDPDLSRRPKEGGWLWPKLIVGDKLLNQSDNSPLIWEMPGGDSSGQISRKGETKCHGRAV